jgi:hypothetical protein
MQRPSDLGGGCASPNATSLILTRMSSCRTSRRSRSWRVRTIHNEGSRTRQGSVLGLRTGIIVMRAETRVLLRLPVRVERPRDFFTSNVLNVRWVPGRRILLNATPANSLSAPIPNRPEHAECNAPPVEAAYTLVSIRCRSYGAGPFFRLKL